MLLCAELLLSGRSKERRRTGAVSGSGTDINLCYTPLCHGNHWRISPCHGELQLRSPPPETGPVVTVPFSEMTITWLCACLGQQGFDAFPLGANIYFSKHKPTWNGC